MDKSSKIHQLLAALVMIISVPAFIGEPQLGFWIFAAGFVWLVVVRTTDWLQSER